MNRTTLISAAVVALLATPAIAADLSVKAPVYKAPPSPPPVHSWTGCYVGLNAGGVWGRMNDDWTPNPADWNNLTQRARVETNGSGSMDGAGFSGGGQIGCNWQTNQFVWGAEADIQYTGLDESRDVSVQVDSTHVETYHSDFSSKWLATFRGRLGWLLNPTVLVYGSGGLAVANVKTTDYVLLFSGYNNTVSNSTTRTGWTVGGGVEWMLAPQWTIKAEYLYVDLGSFDTTSLNSNPDNVNTTINHDHHLKENIARVGLNYHF